MGKPRLSQKRSKAARAAMTPADEIAMYLKRDTGLVVDPKVLHDFIVGRFRTLAILAHEIWEPHKPDGLPEAPGIPD